MGLHTTRPRRTATPRLGRVLAVLLFVAIIAAPGLRQSALAQPAATCVATVNGTSITDYANHRDALQIGRDEELWLGFASQSGRDVSGSVAVELGPVSVQVRSFVAPDGVWTAPSPVRASDHTSIGTGLYRVVVNADGCNPVTGWVNLTGASPLVNPIGATAAAVAVGGIGLAGFALLRGFRTGRGLTLALLAGVLFGVGGCVFSQQLGNHPLSWTSLAKWTTPSVLIAGITNVGGSLVGRRDRSATGGVPVGDRGGWVIPSDAGTGIGPIESMGADGGGTIVIPTGPGWETSAAADESDAMPGGDTGPDGSVDSVSANGGGSVGVATDTGEATDAASAGTEASPEPPASTDGPTLAAYGLLECDTAVLAGRSFPLVVGIASAAVAGVTGGRFEVPAPRDDEGYALLVEVSAEGFTLDPAQAWRVPLRVTKARPYPSTTLELTPLPVTEEQVRSIRALYIVDGQVVGYARRHVTVVPTEADLATAGTPPEEARAVVTVPTDIVPADLTLVIEEDEAVEGRLAWTIASPHTGLPQPSAPMVANIGTEPRQFARSLVDAIGAREGQAGLASYLRGLGRTIANEVPAEFWPLLRAVNAQARAEGRPPTLLILSEEPYVPWELAWLDEPLDTDAEVPRFLAAQACVGRWVLASRRPKLPPPHTVEVSAMAVISGEYNVPGWNRLLEAEAEAQALAGLYAAAMVDARTTPVLECLDGRPAADLLHFAMHGIYDPNSTLNGLVLADGQPLDPLQVRAYMLARQPFVFLNACQVGSSQRILGDYAGIAEAFLFSGAAAVVAPLWSIKDTTAREIALRFYERSFAGTAPAEALRQERATFRDSPESTSATCLAYLFHGHPSLLLRRAGGPDA